MTKTAAPLLLLLLPVLAGAQGAPAEVTDAQVSTYQVGLEAGCKQAGRKRGEVLQKVEDYCNCVIRTLRDNATREQWQQAYFLFSQGRDREEMQVLAPYTPKFQACRG